MAFSGLKQAAIKLWGGGARVSCLFYRLCASLFLQGIHLAQLASHCCLETLLPIALPVPCRLMSGLCPRRGLSRYSLTAFICWGVKHLDLQI